jgi:hypothetical protein
MRTAFFSLLVGSLLIHAACGCCWHHAHDEACGDDAAHALAADDDFGHHHSDMPASHGPHGPCKEQSHCHGLCNYLPAQKSQIDKIELDSSVDFALDVSAMGQSQFMARLVSRSANDLFYAPPLRLHLAYQILLI